MSAEVVSASALLRAVAAYDLPGSPGLPNEPLEDDAFAALLLGCEAHRLVGILGVAARRGDLPLRGDQREQLEQLLQAWLANTLRVERLLLDAAQVLDDAAIQHRVLKGVAVARLAYPEPSWRVFGDLDLLVGAADFARAVDVLEAALGVARDAPELRPGFDNRFGKEALLRTADGLELDLHRTFVEGALGLTVHLPDLFAPPLLFELGNRRLATLPPPQQLLHAAYSAILGDWPPRLSSLRDVAQLMLGSEPNDSETLDLAHRWRARAVFARALTLTWEVLTPAPEPRLVAWARSYRPPAVERLLVRAHVGPARAYTRHAAALLVVPGVTGRLSYLRALAWPQRSYLERRGFTRGRFAGRALGRLPWRLKG